jgi:hypothetical protein
MILMAFMPWSYENAKADTPAAFPTSDPFSLEGQTFPSYPTFREAFNQQVFAAKERLCILANRLDDREMSLALFAASRRAVSTALRVTARNKIPERQERRLEELGFLGVQVLTKPLRSGKSRVPTIIAIDSRAWNVSSELFEFSSGEVSVSPSALTAAEVCRWAEGAEGANAATRR